MKKIMCPCCGNYTHDSRQYLFEICDVCLWQFDTTEHDNPDRTGGANKISLNEARDNYRKHGVSKIGCNHLARLPLPDELPENN